MKRILLATLLLFAQVVYAQNTFRAIVKDAKTHEPLIGTNVFFNSLSLGGTSDDHGMLEIKNIPDGNYTINFSYIGYKQLAKELSFPRENPDKLEIIYLEPIAIQGEQLVVTATRTNGVAENEPVRVEVLGNEEVREETAIKPGNISKLLGETSGIQVQQTSATTGNMTFRIQGLPGKYTQLLKDGFPLYSGFSSGLSLLQIPPLDLQQVEVIKGCVSTLYGGDAIAGIVNLVSKKPSSVTEWKAIINQTHKGGRDVASFYSNRSDKIGVTFIASQSTQDAFDIDKDGFTDIPEFQQTTFNPKLFYYFDKATSLMFSLSTSFENRQGGDIYAIQNAPDSLHSFMEKNKTSRLTTQLKFEKEYRNGSVLTFKNSFNNFHRSVQTTETNFGGEQNSSYSELSYLLMGKKRRTVMGMNFLTDGFRENKILAKSDQLLDYDYFIGGIFAQDDWSLGARLKVQTGIRFDHTTKYGNFFLPRISALYRLTNRLSFRMGYGTGYKLPTVFTDETEMTGFEAVRPAASDLKAETSQGLDTDFSYKIAAGEFLFSVNQAFFYTQIRDALIPDEKALAENILQYKNAASSLEAKGFDTNLKIALDELVLFVDYTFSNVKKNYDSANPNLELTPKHKLNMTLAYEAEGSWRSGLEAFYTGKQYLNANTQSRDFWTIGFMAQKMFKNFSIIGNVENIFDVRQSKYEQVVIGSATNPTFRPICAPLDGIVANVALELKLK